MDVGHNQLNEMLYSKQMRRVEKSSCDKIACLEISVCWKMGFVIQQFFFLRDIVGILRI
jgi:hypothetical protein